MLYLKYVDFNNLCQVGNCSIYLFLKIFGLLSYGEFVVFICFPKYLDYCVINYLYNVYQFRRFFWFHGFVAIYLVRTDKEEEGIEDIAAVGEMSLIDEEENETLANTQIDLIHS